MTKERTPEERQRLRERMEDYQMEFEERAAIMEFDGGMTRQEAERCAKINLNGLRYLERN